MGDARRSPSPAGHRKGALFAAFAVAAGLLSPSPAAAYCRSSTCQGDASAGVQGAVCEPHQVTDCGVPLRWERDCIGFTVQEDASEFIQLSTARKTLAKAFATWEAADCGNGAPGIHAVDMGTVECDRVEYEPNAGNANILIFRDDGWEENGYDKLALTTVNYDTDTGEIWNADIEVNTAGYAFKQGTTGGENDLLAVLTHEVGHFLGLAHSPETDATMYDTYHETMVDLAEDDIVGICSTYPSRPIAENDCNPIPRHGFSSLCANKQIDGQCSVTAPDRRTVPAHAPVVPIAVALGLLVLRRNRGRKGRG